MLIIINFFLDIPLKRTLKGFFKPISKNIESNPPLFSRLETSVAEKNLTHIEFNSNDIIADPGKRKRIEEYDVAIRDQVMREYLLKGPCQPYGHDFPKKK